MKKTFLIMMSVVFSILIMSSLCLARGITTQLDSSAVCPKFKIQGRGILQDIGTCSYIPFVIKGVGYNPIPIGKSVTEYGVCTFNGLNAPQPFTCMGAGTSIYDDPTLMARDLPLIKAMNANVIRTWGYVTPELLNAANSNQLKVMAGFWINHNIDFVNADLSGIRADFVNYVNRYKNDLAVFAWGLSNENNVDFCTFQGAGTQCDRAAQARAFYTLINNMAGDAHSAEGPAYHPVIVVHSGLGDIGNANLNADDNSLTNIDVHGINFYSGEKFIDYVLQASIFDLFKQRSNKPMIITEFATDSWFSINKTDMPKIGIEIQDLQAAYVNLAWDDILKHSATINGPNNGGIYLDFIDQWNASAGYNWDATWVSHDYDYFGVINGQIWTAGQPDNRFNLEWRGIMSSQKDPNGGVDILSPKKVYNTLKAKWQPSAPNPNPGCGKKCNIE